MQEQSTATPAIALEARWRSRRDLSQWVKAFGTYFPRKAHLAERIAARLSGAGTYEALSHPLPHNSLPDLRVEMDDAVFAQRRMVRFKEDRLILIFEYRILPDAADLFLSLCPVGSREYMFEGDKKAYFEPELCYYRDDQEPSTHVDTMLDEQHQQALGQRLETVDSTKRLGYYPHPAVIFNLFHFLGWNYRPDMSGCSKIDPHASVARVGWISDADLGSVECFALRFTAHPAWGRDEVFWNVLAELKRTRNLDSRPVLILNNFPQQLVKDGSTFTSVGWVVMEAKIVPWFITHNRVALADTLVELMTFDSKTSTKCADQENIALSVFWSLLRESAALPLPEHPRFKSLPDNWMIVPAT